MDRISQIRGEAGSSRDSTLDTSSPPSEAYMSANENSSKYFSLSEVDSTFGISPSKHSINTVDADRTITADSNLMSELSPIPKSDLDSYKIGKQIEAANILSGGVNIFDDNDNSYDGNELVIDDNAVEEENSPTDLKLDDNAELPEDKIEENSVESLEDDIIASKDTEVVLQIDGNNVLAIVIGNGLYLYRKAGEEELAAVQIIDDDQQQPSFKFLKVRDNAEGNLEVYEEIEVEVTKEVPIKEGEIPAEKSSHVPINNISKVINEPLSNNAIDKAIKTPKNEISFTNDEAIDSNVDVSEMKTELNLIGKTIKFNESRKSPVIGTFTPMTYHSTPNKEGIPLTKTMVDQQLHPSRHSDNVKKTIEVHTDPKQKLFETPTKSKKTFNEIEYSSMDEDKNETYSVINNLNEQFDVVTEKLLDKNSPVEWEFREKLSEKNPLLSNNLYNKESISEDATFENNKGTKKFEVQNNESNENEGTKEDKNSKKNKELIECENIENKNVMNMENEVAMNIKKFCNTANNIQLKHIEKNEVCKESEAMLIGNNSKESNLITDDKASEARVIENESKESNLITDDKVSETTVLEDEGKESNLITDDKASEARVIENESKESNLITDDKLSETTVLENEGKESNLRTDDKLLEARVIGNESKKLNLLTDDKRSNLTIEQDNTATDDLNKAQPIIEKKTDQTDLITSDNNRKASEAEELGILSAASSNKLSTQTTCTGSLDDFNKALLVTSIDNNDVASSNDFISSNELKRDGNNLNVIGKDTGKNADIIDISEDSNELVILSKCGESDVENKEVNEINDQSNSENKSNYKIATKLNDVCEKDVKDYIEKKNENTLKPNQNFENKSSNIVIDKIIKNKSDDILCDNSVYESDCKIKSSVNKEIVIEENNSTTCKSLNSSVTPVAKQPVLLEIISTKNVVPEKKNVLCVQKDIDKTLPEICKTSDIRTNMKEKNIIIKTQKSLKHIDIKNEAYKDERKTKPTISKPINSNSAVPFGKWTEANRQEFLNKIKETRIPSNNSNTKQLKQPNDLNRRDVLKKIDSQRQSNVTSFKSSDSGVIPKINSKTETSVFVSKSSMVQPSVTNATTVTILNVQDLLVTPKSAVSILTKQDEPTNSNSSTYKNIQRKEINNQDLIDKTIEGIINRAITGKGNENNTEKPIDIEIQNTKHCPVLLDDIEMKMNDIHGIIPCNKQPIQEISHVSKLPAKPENVKDTIFEKSPNSIPFKNKLQQKIVKDNLLEYTSEDEIIEHEPITGDLDCNKKKIILSTKNISPETKKETIITEKDFDKFARRNSITYENCLTVSFDGIESHNVIQTVVEKELPVKKLSRNELMLAESKAKSSNKHNMPVRNNNQTSRIPTLVKGTNEEESFNKSNQSKVQIAYQSALTAKRNLECPITIIEDKPVKVVFMDTNMEFTPAQLNVQGQELSPSKTESECFSYSASECLDSDVLESSKNQSEKKVKTKHQRKQVLTPVEESEIELIEPGDLGILLSPKKKRRGEDKTEKPSKIVVPKKSYLLNRNVNDEKSQNESKNNVMDVKKDSENKSDPFIGHTDAISAIDNLVKAAELIENQSENKTSDIQLPTSETPQNTPIKRGRGRPRKYPLVEPDTDKIKAPSPQKKPRLIDAKVTKTDTTDSDDSIDERIIQENWTMGKINENIVCPICDKLFRSENIVFKHVKHCPGPSPNRSDSDKRSPVRLRHSQDSDKLSHRSDDSDNEEEEIPRSRRSRYTASKLINDNDVIVIEDTPLKVKPEKVEKEVISNSKTTNIQPKTQQSQTYNLICEFCGKTFRQLSYLVNHKIQQHKKENSKSVENVHQPTNKTIFSCEVCKKDFRKLHHLVQHRLIHNSNTNNIRLTRKSSSDQHDNKPLKSRDDSKSSPDPSAGFRCEPCDKSFRKLHHLVEHRETHDGINKKSSSTSTSSIQHATESVDIAQTHNCDICKKVFENLQYLLEHKELHFETSSEKSDDKSVKSSLSTKDIIHECSLCYMVFPNEHSLNKHTVLCLRKKKQSAAKAAKQAIEKAAIELESENCKIIEDDVSEDESPNNLHQVDDEETTEPTVSEDSLKVVKKNEIIQPLPDNKIGDQINMKKHNFNADFKQVVDSEKKIVDKEDGTINKSLENVDKPAKIKKKEIQEYIIIPDTPTPKKKIHVKDKVFSTISKKIKTVSNSTSPVVKDPKHKESSDEDDEIRYMFNPNFKKEESSEIKLFMKVRAKKRNSLQIERPNSKDLVKRRISLQHPPKIPRLKTKTIETKPIVVSRNEKKIKLDVKETILSTDSDDSDIKYSFPDRLLTEVNKDKKVTRQSVAAKRKSISVIPKRNTIGKHKLATPKTRKRTCEAEHRCDCGQLFSSAALLSRHTSLAHTPPRIRRRRSPQPDHTRKSLTRDKPKPIKRKSDVTTSNTTNPGVATRKSSVSNSDAKDSSNAKKCEFSGKSLRSSKIRGMPVPEKIRKLMEKPRK